MQAIVVNPLLSEKGTYISSVWQAMTRNVDKIETESTLHNCKTFHKTRNTELALGSRVVSYCVTIQAAVQGFLLHVI